MNTKSAVLSLITDESDYQLEEAVEAERVAQQLGIRLKVIYAGGDAVTQSQQLLDFVFSKTDRPDALIVQPVGTSLAQVAKAAVTAGIGWCLLNRDMEYRDDLRALGKAPVIEVTTDHFEMGRIQGRQMAALFPDGDLALYLENPAVSTIAQQRKAGMLETKPSQMQVRAVRSMWGRHAAIEAVKGFLRLPTSHQLAVNLVVAQSDTLAMGARDAFDEIKSTEERQRWLSLPFLGVDGCNRTGKVWTDKGLLRATVRMPMLSGVALDLFNRALHGTQVEPRKLIMPESYPALGTLRPMHTAVH